MSEDYDGLSDTAANIIEMNDKANRLAKELGVERHDFWRTRPRQIADINAVLYELDATPANNIRNAMLRALTDNVFTVESNDRAKIAASTVLLNLVIGKEA